MAAEKGQPNLVFIFKGLLAFCSGLLVAVWVAHIMFGLQGEGVADSFVAKAATAVIGAGAGIFCTLIFFVYSAIRRKKTETSEHTDQSP
jgi:hypothetical protein